MADSLKSLVMDQLTDLHDSIVLHLDDHSAREVLGDDLNQLRSSGTGKSLVMLALLDDLLRITEIVLAKKWEPLEPAFAEFAAPFFQTAARTLSRKGLKQYAPFENLTAENAGRFLEYHSESGRPFGGRHAPTQWSGLKICTNVATRFANLATITGYERLTQILLAALRERVRQFDREEVRQLKDFLSDRCGDVRDQLQAKNKNHATGQDAFSQELEELGALRAELESLKAELAEREQLIGQEWRRFQQERAEFEQLRQRWEERLADSPDRNAQTEQLANERETIAIEKAALNHKRQELEQLQAELERTEEALSQEREELAGLRERLLTEQKPPEDEDHVLFELDTPSRDVKNAAVITAGDANRLLESAVISGDRVQVEAALQFGADPNRIASEQDWQTPLHLAARRGHAEIVEVLLDAGADAEQTDAESLSPLESAIINEQPQSARLLASRVPEAVAQAHPLLLRIMRDPKSPPVSRRLSVEIIATRQGDAADAIPTLLNLLESENRELGKAAARALANIDAASLTRQAIPYVSEILKRPLVKDGSTDQAWVANLYAVRGDLSRLAGRLSEAQKDYEAALELAAPDQQADLREMINHLERHATKTSLS